jgi:hypothetical protein
VDYYETSGVAAHHYADVLAEKGILYKWIAHDIKQKEWLSEKSRIESLIGLGIEPTIVPDHRVNAVRRVLGRSFIDPDRCFRGLEALRNYVREWSVDLRDWRASPRHDWACHAADSLRIFAMGHIEPDFKPKGRL